jgi:NADPH:quinone reductase-like Zn-dependent oxidoreductase
MKAYQIGPQTGLDSLHLVERADPVAGPGEVIVRVTAVCLNHRDLLVLRGKYGALRPETRVPVSDGVGVIKSVGAGVTAVAPGDRVACPHFVSWIGGDFSPAAFGADLGVSLDGWLAEKIAVPAAALVKIPDAISDDDAATLSAAGLTAWQSVVEVGEVKPGQTVLTLGTGGVSLFALQIAKLAGARVAITSSSDAKLAKARELGADIVVNYRTTPDWPAAVLASTGGRGADVVLETGGAATLPQSIAAAAPNGKVMLIGALAGPSDAPPLLGPIIGKNLGLKGITAGSREMFARFVAAAASSGMKPVIDRSFAFAEAPAAYAYLDSAAHMGKVMIRVG